MKLNKLKKTNKKDKIFKKLKVKSKNVNTITIKIDNSKTSKRNSKQVIKQPTPQLPFNQPIYNPPNIINSYPNYSPNDFVANRITAQPSFTNLQETVTMNKDSNPLNKYSIPDKFVENILEPELEPENNEGETFTEEVIVRPRRRKTKKVLEPVMELNQPNIVSPFISEEEANIPSDMRDKIITEYNKLTSILENSRDKKAKQQLKRLKGLEHYLGNDYYTKSRGLTTQLINAVRKY
jgi:hypothetical protein